MVLIADRDAQFHVEYVKDPRDIHEAVLQVIQIMRRLVDTHPQRDVLERQNLELILIQARMTNRQLRNQKQSLKLEIPLFTREITFTDPKTLYRSYSDKWGRFRNV